MMVHPQAQEVVMGVVSKTPTNEELEQRVQELEQEVSGFKELLEESLAKERSYRCLFDGLSVALYRTDEDGRILEANKALAEMLGFSSPHHLHYQLSTRFFMRSEEQVKQRAILKREGVLNCYELQLRRGDGSNLWVRDSARCIQGLDGQVYYEGSLENITDRKQQEQEYLELFDGMNDTAFVIGFDGRFRAVNKTALEVLGYSREELLEMGPADIDPFLKGKEIQNLLIGMKTEERQVFETEHRAKDGNIIQVEISSSRVTYQGEPCVLSIARDITERKRVESEHRLRSMVLDQIQDRVTVTDLNGIITYVNDAESQMLGMKRDEVLGRHVSIYGDDPEAGATQKEIIRETLANGMWQGEVVNFGADGEPIFLHARTRVVRDRENRPIALCGISTDISDRKRMEIALRESEQKFRSITEQSSDLIALTDMNGVITYASPASAQIFGAQPENMVGRHFNTFLDETSLEKAAQAFGAAVKSGKKTEALELLMKRVDGLRFYGELTGSFYAFPSMQGTLVVIRDVSERKRLEQEIRQADKMKAIGTLAGGIAHDFNNILGIIVGNTEVAMLDVPEGNPALENLKEVREATLRARELVKQILLFARQKEHSFANINLEPIVKESLKMLRASLPTTVEIRRHIKKNLPCVFADPSQIQQIIMNLCTNAGQAVESEGGTLDFTLETIDLKRPLHTVMEELSPGRYVRMEVRDTGPGIPSGILDRIFDPFFTTKEVGQGTGLGLAVVQGIVRGCGGGIAVDSEAGRGAAFSVYLPASEVEPVESAAEKTKELARGTERVLFVDDEPMIRELGKRVLERQGYSVKTCGSGTDALAVFKQDPSRFDLLVTDMTMPGMRGDKLAEEVLAIREDIPIILCTGYSRQISREKAEKIGARAFVMKPLTRHELVSTVRRVLDQRPRGPIYHST